MVIRTPAGVVIAGRYFWRVNTPKPLARLLDLSPRCAPAGMRVTLQLTGDLTYSPLGRVTPHVEVRFGPLISPSVQVEDNHTVSAEVPPGESQVELRFVCLNCYARPGVQALPFDYN